MLAFSIVSYAQNTVYQWSIPIKSVVSTETSGHQCTFLCVPSHCRQLKGAIVAQHNMSEENILEHPAFRKEMSKLEVAEVWVTPAFNITFNFNDNAGIQFEEMIKSLAEESGYKELTYIPVIPIGHSALASYPWNFAAWNPVRTLAVISVHGDAPLTQLTGSGQPNPDWGGRNIDEVPGLMIMGEYEWWKDRLQPVIDFQKRFPETPISFFIDVGHGHFDVSDELINYLTLFIRKA